MCQLGCRIQGYTWQRCSPSLMILWLALPFMLLYNGQHRLLPPSIGSVLTQRSQHHKHLSHTRGRKDPASPVEPRPMTGSLGCFGTCIQWQATVLPLSVVHRSHPPDPSYGRKPSMLLPRRLKRGWRAVVGNFAERVRIEGGGFGV